MSPANREFNAAFAEAVGQAPQINVSLREFSHFKIGGPAEYFSEIKTLTALSSAVKIAKEFKVPFYLIGGGFNLLFSDEGYHGLILKNSMRGIRQTEENTIEAHSGTSLRKIIDFCVERDLAGLEFMAGIPGTLGGAVFGNAGAYEQSIGERLIRASVFQTDGRTIVREGPSFQFSYRHSDLKKHHDILCEATLLVQKGQRQKIEGRIADILKKRSTNHPPWGTACAGSYFKNPVLPDGTKVPAARFLEKVGAKGMNVGGASVYAHHANFIVNAGNATAQNVRDLADELKLRVHREFGIVLEEEVIYLPESGTAL